MNKTCPKCGVSLQENDFLCPKCGAIYGEPVYEAPKQEEKPAPVPKKRRKLPLVVVPVMGLLVAIVCVLLWNPFQPAQTPTTAPAATTVVFPTTSAVPTPPPTTEPATVPTTVPPTTLPSNMKRLDWALDAKVVDPTGRLISNGTVKISGLITKNADAADTIVLTIVFPSTCSYLFGNDKEYFDRGGGLFGSYYVCTASVVDSYDGAPDFIKFAFDTEGECAIFILPENDAQYLVCSTAADVDVQEVMTHFQTFINAYK